jgi:transcription antitermination factor NusG
MDGEKKWYAVYTRPRWEKKVAELLNRKKVENYCPLNKVMKQWSDRRKTIQEPLFTSYVFVYVTEREHLSVKQTDGVLNFVYWLGEPALIRDEEIEAIKTFLTRHEDVKLERIHVNVSDKVRVVDGPLMYREGDVLEVYNKSVKVFLPSLGYAMVAEISRSNIEVINYTNGLSKPFHHANVG